MATGDITGYRLTPKAEDDLEAIWRYSAETWSAAQADTYIDTLIATIEAIVGMPTLARERVDFDPHVRIHPAAEHLIIYCMEADAILVTAFLAGDRTGAPCWRSSTLDRR